MLFSSVPFLFYFLPAALLIYLAAPRQLKNAVMSATLLCRGDYISCRELPAEIAGVSGAAGLGGGGCFYYILKKMKEN